MMYTTQFFVYELDHFIPREERRVVVIDPEEVTGVRVRVRVRVRMRVRVRGRVRMRVRAKVLHPS
jgi:hypothetical protein